MPHTSSCYIPVLTVYLLIFLYSYSPSRRLSPGPARRNDPVPCHQRHQASPAGNVDVPYRRHPYCDCAVCRPDKELLHVGSVRRYVCASLRSTHCIIDSLTHYWLINSLLAFVLQRARDVAICPVSRLRPIIAAKGTRFSSCSYIALSLTSFDLSIYSPPELG